MKFNHKPIIALTVAFAASATVNASAFDLKTAIGKIAQQTDSSSTKGENIGDLIGGVANAFGIGDNVQMKDLIGTWRYKEPAVAFQSENLLMKAGGAAAAKTVEDKLAPYYKMAGCDNMTMTVEADSTFTMKLKMGTFSGKISTEDNGKKVFFHFALLKRINIGTMEAFIKRSSKDEVEITYDVSALITILEKAGSISGRSSLKTLTALLKNYDGITAGFALKKTK